MPCSFAIGRLRPIWAKSSLRHYGWFTTQQQRLTTTRPMTALFVASGCGVAMYANDHHVESVGRIGRAALVGLQVALDYQWWYVSVRYLHARSMDADHAERLKQACHERSAQRVLHAMQELGGIYIKLGQHLSAMHYILPDPWTRTLAVLQDQCPVVSTPAELEYMFYQDTGQRMDQVVERVDWHPLGVASLAQVHKAMYQGQPVAIKCQHPSIATHCRLDLQCVTAVVGALQWLFPEFGFGWLVDEMNEALPLELDFTNEANNAEHVRANFKDDPSALVVPKVLWATPRLLCMEYIEGARPDDLDYMKRHNIDPVQVSIEITTIFSKMMFLHGFVHCDPHPGNLLIRPSRDRWGPNFDVVLLDHGQYRTLSNELRTDYAHLWTSLIRGDEKGIAMYAYKLGCRAPHHRLFASLLTGREWHTIASQNLATPKTGQETDRVAGRTHLFLQKIAAVLSSLPRIMLLLLKTSDLLRHLNTSLGGATKYGSMVQCCNEAVWLDARQKLCGSTGFAWCYDYLAAWWEYTSLDWAIWWSR